MTKESIINELNKYAKDLKTDPQAVLNQVDQLCSAPNSYHLMYYFRDSLVIEGVHSRSEIIGDLEHAIIDYAHHDDFGIIADHANEGRKIFNSNHNWFNEDIVKGHGIRHTPVTTSRARKIVNDIKADVSGSHR